jgi:hypothetical protein
MCKQPNVKRPVEEEFLCIRLEALMGSVSNKCSLVNSLVDFLAKVQSLGDTYSFHHQRIIMEKMMIAQEVFT